MTNDPHPLDYFSPRPADLVRVYTARDGMEAEFVRGMLEEAGIAAVVQGGAVNAMLGSALGAIVAAEVHVPKADLPAAQQVIKQYEQGGRGGSQPWVCPACGERIEGQFTHCWKCGAAREAAQADDDSTE